jgi:hypothetical protein
MKPALTVQIARFAALLGDRHVVIVVHKRALFGYLTVALSPAVPGANLKAVEITRIVEGKAVVNVHAFGFEDDREIAA